LGLCRHGGLQLFNDQNAYFDGPVSTQTPLQVRENLAKLAAGVIGESKVEQFRADLQLGSTPNSGIPVTNDLKYTIKYSRALGIHVSPTVLWDGIEQKQVSSSWGEKEWSEFLAQNVLV
jgi:hypothetical protein